MLTKTDLLSVADVYLAATGQPEGRVSYWVFNDTKTLRNLRAGATISIDRFNAALTWFAARWPADVALPAVLAGLAPPPEGPSPDQTPETPKTAEDAA